MMRLQRMKLLRHIAIFALFATSMLVAAPMRAALIDLTPSNGSNSTGSVLLSDLISGAVTGVTVGDKIFTGFNYSFLGDMPAPVNVQVIGFKDPSGNWGVTFHGAFMDNPGGSSSDALLRFDVNIDPAFLARGFRISDAHLFMSGSGTGSDSVFLVDESFLGLNNTLHTFMSTLGTGGTQLHDSTVFNPVVQTLHVTKDIFANAGSTAFLPARATAIDQSFSQTNVVPEPTTALISMIGLIGSVFISRKRSRG